MNAKQQILKVAKTTIAIVRVAKRSRSPRPLLEAAEARAIMLWSLKPAGNTITPELVRLSKNCAWEIMNMIEGRNKIMYFEHLPMPSRKIQG